MRVDSYEIGQVPEDSYRFAVIAACYQGKWVFVRHKERKTWEIPGGHREIGEDIKDTASRELFEETGAKVFEITPIFDYSVTVDDRPSFGRLFYSEIEELGRLPDMEIGEVKLFSELPQNLTYPGIQPYLFEKTLDFCERRKTNG